METENGGSGIQKIFVTYVGVVILTLQFYVDKVQVLLLATVTVTYMEVRAQNNIHDYIAWVLNFENVSNI